MSYNNFSVPNSWAPIPPETLFPFPDPPLLDRDDRLLSVAETRGYQGMPQDHWVRRDSTPATVPMPATHTSPVVTEAFEAGPSAERLRPLAAASAREGTRAEGRESVPKARKPRVRKVVTGKRSEKVPQACERCRRHKQKCSGQKPECKRCGDLRTRITNLEPCSYGPSPKQTELVQRQAAENFIGYPAPVATAPVRKRNPTAPGRRILAHPGAPAADYGGLTANPDQHREYFEAPGVAFGGPAAGPEARSQRLEEFDRVFGGLAAGSGRQQHYPQDLDLGFGGMDAGPTGNSERSREPDAGFGGLDSRLERSSQHPQVPYTMFEDWYTRPHGFLHYPQEPVHNFAELGTWQNGYVQRLQQPESMPSVYSHTPSDPSPFLGEPMLASGGSSTQSNGISPYIRDPGMGFDGPPALSHGDLPSYHEPAMGFTFNDFEQYGPYNGQAPIGLNHDDEQE